MPSLAITHVRWTIYFHYLPLFGPQLSMDNEFAWVELYGKAGVLWHIYDTPSEKRRHGGVRPVGAASA